MNAVLASRQDRRPPKQGGHAKAASERRCLVTGETGPKDGLIRFVVDPAGQLVPDLAARLPGRGLWVTASRPVVDKAVNKGLFSKAAKTKVSVASDLAERVDALLARRCLELLGLARGAGLVVAGQPQVEADGKTGRLSYVLVAADAGTGAAGVERLAPHTVRGFTRDQLGQALGRDQLVYVGVRPHALADTLRAELARWRGMHENDHQGES